MATYTFLNLVVVVFAVAGGCAPDPAAGRPAVAETSQAQQHPSASPPSAPAGSRDTVPLDSVFARARSPSAGARRAAVLTLAQPGPRMEDRLRVLASALHDTNRAVGLAAVVALGNLGPASLPTLVTALSDHNPEIRRRAVYALGRTGQEAAVPAIRDAMSDPDRSVRDMASWASNRFRPMPGLGSAVADLGTTEDLRAGLSAREPADRLGAIQRYQPYADDPQDAIRLLIRALGDGDGLVRAGAADALVNIGPASRTQLAAALSDSNPVIRREASVALVRLGRGGP
jgi:HEAT repeat protein